MSRYEEICAGHEWDVPERYNIAADICDKHPPDKLAMIFEDHTGTRREVTWGEQQSLANRAANMLAAHGVGKGDRVAVCVPASPETAAVFFGTWKAGGILIAMSVLYGDDGIEHRIRTSGAKVIVTDSADAGRMPADLVDHVIELDAELLAGYDDSFETLDTLADDPAEIFFTSGTTGLAKGILHAHRYILAHEEFEYCHEIEEGEIFHGMGEWAWAAGICPLLGAWRLGAVAVRLRPQGRLRPGGAARGTLPQRGQQRLHHADRDAGDDVDRRRGREVPAGIPPGLLGRRGAQPRGDPLVPRAVRGDGSRLLRPQRVLSAGRQLPFHGGPRGLDGKADAGLGRPDPRRRRESGRPGRARGDLHEGAQQPSLSRCATGRTPKPRSATSKASGSTPRTPPKWTRTATTGSPAGPTT